MKGGAVVWQVALSPHSFRDPIAPWCVMVPCNGPTSHPGCISVAYPVFLGIALDLPQAEDE